MARAKVIRKQDRCFVELPKEFLSSEEIELFTLRDGYYLLSMPLEPRAQSPVSRAAKQGTPDAGPSPEEIAVLHKLQAIKFGDRTPDNVSGSLSGPEKEVLAGLESKGWVNVFIGNKYKNGVYNIADDVFPLLKAQGQATGARDSRTKVNQAQQPAKADPSPSYALLTTQGYLVIKDGKDAAALSDKLKSEMRSGAVVGTKGFDGSFYVVTRDFFGRASKAILAALAEDADVGTIASACKIDSAGVRAVLQQLAESGDVIEKRKGVFAAV